MSTQTQLAIRGLARDANPFAAARAGALRRAENVVVRSEGVAESRPNFDVLFENTGGTNWRVRALHEFAGALITVEQDGADWRITHEGTANTATVQFDHDLGEPLDHDECEPKFAEARGNLYVAGANGQAVLDASDAALRYAGVDAPPFFTDYQAPLMPNNEEPTYSYAYRFVLVREDDNGYVRRSPPSHRFCIVINSKEGTGPGAWAKGTRCYLGARSSSLMKAGDKIEAYRTRITEGLEPRPEHYLAWTYELTSTDVSNKYFPPPTDTTADDELGAQLYTDSALGGEIAAKFPPPASALLAWWQRCMWFGKLYEKARVVVELHRFFRAGAGVPFVPGHGLTASFTAGSSTVTIGDTSELEPGQYYTDNLKKGPGTAGTYVPANTYIVSITNATDFVLSANALATGSAAAGVMSPDAPRGIVAETTTGDYTITSPVVTNVADTSGVQVGMYWTDRQYGPALVAGTNVPTGTKVVSKTINTVTLDKNALATNAGVTSYYGDIVTIGGIDFYAWIDYGTFTLMADPWTHVALNRYYNCFAIGSPGTYGGFDPHWLATTNLAIWVAYACNGLGSAALSTCTTRVIGDFFRGANVGVINYQYKDYFRPPEAATSIVIESLLANMTGQDLTVSCTAPLGIAPANPLEPEATSKLNRLYFSDLDEPEAVPLGNYFDIGDAGHRILALVPLRDALLVFKEDGIWRVTGAGPSAWTVDPLDTTLRLVRPETVDVVNGVAYAWCDRGFFAVTEGGAQSLSANALDVELRELAQTFLAEPATHGAFVLGWRRRNLVLLGVPNGEGATKTVRIYAYCLTTQAWSEWPVAWGPVCESATKDAVYYARPSDEAEYEVRVASEGNPRGYDREYTLANVTIDGVEVTVAAADIGAWLPAIGDFVGVNPSGGTAFVFRRIVDYVLDLGVYTITLESGITVTTESPTWKALEAAPIVIEWHPAAPAGVPVGAMVREIHVQMDLRDGYDTKYVDAIPSYAIGGTPERAVSATTLTSNKTRLAQIQPIRVGAARAIARAANMAPILRTSDVFAQRVLGISLVHERTSERTTR